MNVEDSDDELTGLAVGAIDLIVMSDGVTMKTHGPETCVGPFCCIHNPSEHPLRTAPMTWFAEMSLMFRVCEHGNSHPDPDSLEFRQLLVYIGLESPYDGWHPCCDFMCCQEPHREDDDDGD